MLIILNRVVGQCVEKNHTENNNSIRMDTLNAWPIKFLRWVEREEKIDRKLHNKSSNA